MACATSAISIIFCLARRKTLPIQSYIYMHVHKIYSPVCQTAFVLFSLCVCQQRYPVQEDDWSVSEIDNMPHGGRGHLKHLIYRKGMEATWQRCSSMPHPTSGVRRVWLARMCHCLQLTLCEATPPRRLGIRIQDLAQIRAARMRKAAGAAAQVPRCGGLSKRCCLLQGVMDWRSA